MTGKPGDLTEVLPHLRGIVRMSQKQLAQSSGVSLARIQTVEAGGARPKADTLKKLSDGLARDAFTDDVDGERSAVLYGDLMRAAGASPAEVSVQARHRNPAITMQTYVHSTPQSRRRMLEIMESMHDEPDVTESTA